MQLHILLSVILVHWSSLNVDSQTSINWDDLADVKFKTVYDADLGMDILEADPGAHLATLDGQEVVITGFMIPLNALGTSYVLSRFPNANCFFCGGAGPETILELKLKPTYLKRYSTDTYATFRGRLRLHERNLHSLNFVLMDAEKVD
jgi:hypothetical protein